MCAKLIDQKSEQLVDTLLIPVKNQFHFDSKGNVFGSNVGAFTDLVTAILSYLEFNEEIPEFNRYEMLSHATWQAQKAKTLSAKGLLGQISREENDYLSKPKLNYEFASSLSVTYFPKLNRSRLKPPIRFSREPPKKLDLKSISERFHYVKEIPANYTFFQVPVKARNPPEAYVQGMEAIDLMRAIWNWAFFPQQQLFDFDQSPKPLNKVTLGPLHSVIEPGGDLSEGFWYEIEFRELPIDISRGFDKLTKYEQKIRRRLSRHFYRKDFEKYMRRYAQALDYLDKHVAFAKLWQVMEKLTDTNNANYEQMIKRIVFLYPDPDLHKAILQHLRHFRNSSIHDAREARQIETYLHQLLRYVKTLFDFHIHNPFKAKSLSEAVVYLDETTDPGILSGRADRYKKVLKFQAKIRK